MAKLAENEVSDLSGCRYLRMRYTEQSQELSFLAKCEKGIRNTLRRGSVLARRLSTAAASGFPMKITIRKVERAADFRLVVWQVFFSLTDKFTLVSVIQVSIKPGNYTFLIPYTLQ